MGDFNSARFDITVASDVRPGESRDEALSRVRADVMAQVTREVRRLRGR